jgi:Acyl-CoA thioesterase C-terminal domain/Acyl-CoA thioesterase N-terminal domain
MTGFFEPTADPGVFVATAASAGNWSPTLQHAGPPAALLAREIGALAPSIAGPVQVTRFAVDILGPVPIGPVVVSARVLRPGRTVELVEARLDADGRPAMLARAWRTRVADLALPVAGGPGPVEVPPIPDGDRRGTYRLAMWNRGYADAVDWRFITGSEEGGGPVAVWARQRIDLVAGEPPAPLSRLLLLADTGNGLSRVLDVDTWWFINTELTVHLHRPPAGEWYLLAARTVVEPTGGGMTETELFDVGGRLGRAAQALVVGPR